MNINFLFFKKNKYLFVLFFLIIFGFSFYLLGSKFSFATCPPDNCLDWDNDGYGSPASILCDFPELDCNDSDPSVTIGTPEGASFGNCDDGIDNDCDGRIDCDDPDCSSLSICDAGCAVTCLHCLSIVPSNASVTTGECCDSSKSCYQCDPGANWNVAGSDCVLITTCTDGETRSCGSDVGTCEEGIETCAGGVWGGVCVGEITPVAEICNDGKDNNCDGFVDCADADCSSDPACAGVDACIFPFTFPCVL